MGQMFILTLKVMLSSRMQVLLQHVYIILGLQRRKQLDFKVLREKG